MTNPNPIERWSPSSTSAFSRAWLDRIVDQINALSYGSGKSGGVNHFGHSLPTVLARITANGTSGLPGQYDATQCDWDGVDVPGGYVWSTSEIHGELKAPDLRLGWFRSVAPLVVQATYHRKIAANTGTWVITSPYPQEVWEVEIVTAVASVTTTLGSHVIKWTYTCKKQVPSTAGTWVDDADTTVYDLFNTAEKDHVIGTTVTSDNITLQNLEDINDCAGNDNGTLTTKTWQVGTTIQAVERVDNTGGTFFAFTDKLTIDGLGDS